MQEGVRLTILICDLYAIQSLLINIIQFSERFFKGLVKPKTNTVSSFTHSCHLKCLTCFFSVEQKIRCFEEYRNNNGPYMTLTMILKIYSGLFGTTRLSTVNNDIIFIFE